MPIFLSNPSADALPKQADVVIIGGGPAGAAALWALHRADPTLSLVLIESNKQLASGSSTASLENFRTAWSTVCIAKQMQRSIDIYKNADEYLGQGAQDAIHIKQRGYLFCGFNEHHAQDLKADVQHLNDIGMREIEYLNADEMRYRFGWVGNNVIAGKYDPTAGWLDSYALVYRYVQTVPNAHILLEVEHVQICVENARVCGVKTQNGTITTANVIIASGASANVVAKTAGVTLPIVLRPRQSFTTDFRHAEFPEDAPMIIGSSPFPHVRPEAGKSAIFNWEYTWHSKHVDPCYGTNENRDAILEPVIPIEQLKDPRYISIVLALLARQFGHKAGEGFADPRYMRGIRHNVGYYVYRDSSVAYQTLADGRHEPYDSERAILDQHPDVEGLFLSIAHSGHGIMTSASGGEIIASKVLKRDLPDPIFAQFGLDVPYVDYDANAL